MINFQTGMSFSKYPSLYDRVISKNHMMCKISEEIVFMMIEDEIVINTAWTMQERPFQCCLQQGCQDVCLQSRQHKCEENHHLERKEGKRMPLLPCCRTTSMWRSANGLRIEMDATRKVQRPSFIPSR